MKFYFAVQAAYDKLLKARKAAELRNKALESKRRKIKEGNTVNSV